jgi:hypothetical protein
MFLLLVMSYGILPRTQSQSFGLVFLIEPAEQWRGGPSGGRGSGMAGQQGRVVVVGADLPG